MKGRQSVFFLDFASFLFLIKKSENLPAHSNVLFFCTAWWLSSDFSLCLLFFLWRQSPVSQWGMINSKLISLSSSSANHHFFFPLSFSWFNQVRNIIDFFFLCFVFYLRACAQWKHSPLSVAHVTSFFLSPFHFDSLCVSSASVQSF